ncbi:hypothetical protein O181_084891 [Austropuccinia psidii MF-1]|uniref:GAG-pre-integrase domain-containing protein n=1 Tax=Austropuccinia psidii MF-1 TaxID=1389203 RepID=A0A9Q3FRV1_9BASI|nr:hypothetical protein [Austropuccinia psidii MF-1]
MRLDYNHQPANSPNVGATSARILYSLAYQQHQSNTTPTKQDDTIVFNKASVVNSSAQGGSYDANDINPATLRAVIRGTCHNCKKAGNFVCDCQAKRTGNASSPLINNASQFRAYYPILTPPTWSATRPLVAADSQKPKPADYYQPNYKNKPMTPVNVHFAELGDDEDLMNFSQTEVANNESVGGGELEKEKNGKDMKKDETLMWNKLFGHCGMQQLRNFLKDRIGTGISKNLDNTVDNCADCLIANNRCQNELLSTRRKTEPMEIVASDLMGPFDQSNINLGCWALTIRDVSST